MLLIGSFIILPQFDPYDFWYLFLLINEIHPLSDLGYTHNNDYLFANIIVLIFSLILPFFLGFCFNGGI